MCCLCFFFFLCFVGPSPRVLLLPATQYVEGQAQPPIALAHLHTKLSVSSAATWFGSPDFQDVPCDGGSLQGCSLAWGNRRMLRLAAHSRREFQTLAHWVESRGCYSYE